MGYTHIDTAEMYENEAEIREVIQDFDREKLFITSKVWYEHLAYHDVINACKKSLKKLKTDYLNLYLVHWPDPEGWDMKETFEALKKLHSDGLIKGVGESNFVKKHLQDNINIFDFEIADLDIRKIDSVNQNKRVVSVNFSDFDDQ